MKYKSKQTTLIIYIIMYRDNIKLLAFDADDTLWDCQSHFNSVERAYCKLLADYGTADEISQALFATETADMPHLGYGCKAFTISLVENAIQVSNGKISAGKIMEAVSLGRSLLELSATPLPYVKDTLKDLQERNRYSMVVFTKGEILDQENKLRRSGLAKYFDDAVIVADKTKEEYAKLCRRFGVKIDNFMMIGNSFKSDIEPVLQLGGYAAHIPFHTLWKYEAAEEYDHERLVRLNRFDELIKIL